MTTPDSSGISFTALYTGAVWHRSGLSDDALVTAKGQWLYHLMRPFEAASKALVGGNLQTFLLQRHLIIDDLTQQALDGGCRQVIEIACGMSPRGLRLRARNPHLHMVEADLPDMAARKALRLMAEGHLGDHHQVTPIDILAEDGPRALESVLDTVFPNNDPVVVITEGLTAYFSLETISDFWHRLSTALARRPGSLYLSESYLKPSQPLLKGTLDVLGRGLGGLTRSQVSFHFADSDEARNHFEHSGFSKTCVHNPTQFYDRLPIPRSRHDPLIRIIEARV